MSEKTRVQPRVKRKEIALRMAYVKKVSMGVCGLKSERDNVRVHRAAANKLNIESRATRGSVCNALLSGALAIGFSVLPRLHLVLDLNNRFHLV